MKRIFKHYPSTKIFLEELRMSADYVVQCINCHVARLPDPNQVRVPGQVASMVLRVIDELNDWLPSVQQLEELGIFVSHGSCRCCVRKHLETIIRKQQKREGHFDCFGKAIDSCSQVNCKYHNPCVVSCHELRLWELRTVLKAA